MVLEAFSTYRAKLNTEVRLSSLMWPFHHTGEGNVDLKQENKTEDGSLDDLPSVFLSRV